MILKNVSYDEEEKLENLRSYNIPDTGVEENYQNITKLAAAICQAPIALINLIDSDRQGFKSMGLEGVPETPGNISFCTRAIEENDILIIEDASEDERFKHNPLVTGDPFIRFYAGAQIRTQEGSTLGTLCVIDQRPGKLSDQQKEALKILAQQVSDLLILRRVNSDLVSAKKALEEQQELLINKARHQTIGELAGGVCHQINNPLAIIVGRSMILRSQIKQRVPDNEDFLKELDVIDQTSKRVSGILKALRTYSREMGSDFSEANILEVIEDAMTLMRGKLISSKVELTFEGKGEIFLQMNKNQIGQVILDLVSNSIESMKDSSEKRILLKVEERINDVIITVEDTGEGISEDIRKKIFNPFFSTRPQHFGVGLSNARSLVLQHKGEIKVVSLKNPTVFEVKIPKSF